MACVVCSEIPTRALVDSLIAVCKYGPEMTKRQQEITTPYILLTCSQACASLELASVRMEMGTEIVPSSESGTLEAGSEVSL